MYIQNTYFSSVQNFPTSRSNSILHKWEGHWIGGHTILVRIQCKIESCFSSLLKRLHWNLIPFTMTVVVFKCFWASIDRSANYWLPEIIIFWEVIQLLSLLQKFSMVYHYELISMVQIAIWFLPFTYFCRFKTSRIGTYGDLRQNFINVYRNWTSYLKLEKPYLRRVDDFRKLNLRP